MLAGRNGFIEDPSKFYGADKILKKYEDSARATFEWYYKNKNASLVIIYGELFGGSYPHPDVSRDPHGSKVQKGVYYCPHNDLYVFDVYIKGACPHPEAKYSKYDNFSNVLRVLDEVTIFKTPKVLATGTFDELLNYKNDGLSQVYLDFDLPPIEDNIMEGYVLMPDEDLYFRSGERVAFKNKNSKFAEKSKEKKRPLRETDHKLQAVLDAIEPYITENRLRNVLSHIGPVTNKDFGTVAKAFIKDIYEDFVKEDGDKVFNTLEQTETKTVNKMINKRASKLISSNFLNIIDGNY